MKAPVHPSANRVDSGSQYTRKEERWLVVIAGIQCTKNGWSNGIKKGESGWGSHDHAGWGRCKMGRYDVVKVSYT